MGEVTWDHVVYLACISALCWGVALFDYFREEGEKEWERHQMRQAFREMARALYAVGPAVQSSTDTEALQKYRDSVARFALTMDRFGGRDRD